MSNGCKLRLAALVIGYLACLALAITGTKGLFGMAPDPFAAVPLILAGAPWSLVPALAIALAGTDVSVTLLDGVLVPTGQAVAALAPIANIWWLMRKCRQKDPA